ncbi:MAG: succinyl-diaminopimelate desuccinylase [Hyphomicrobiales bacterium]|nr:succinyl-diaminopimelate desuccinylase [Hyphomicrobiales bacterium]
MPAPSALEIARDLIRCASVTPRDEGALDVVARVLEPAGFAVERVRFGEPGTPDVDNLYARIGTGSPCLLFAGHTDVVPPGDAAAWRFDPFSAEVADGMVWGRGAVDMKGGLAACLAAAVGHVAQNGAPRGSIAFLVTGDEEGPAVNGTVKLLDWAAQRGERFDHCLLGEPTNPAALGDMIKIGRRGSLTGRILVRGKQGHVGYPHLADNPVDAMVRVLAALKGAPLDAGTDHFEPSNLEITTVDVGNPATNVIPAEARATFNIRFNDLWTPQSLETEIRRRVAEAAGTARIELSFDPTNAVAFLTTPGPFVDQVAAAIVAETGRNPVLSTSGGTSDARFIQAHCPVVEFGLVGSTMHAVDERCAVSDLEQLSAIYGRVLHSYFA